MSDEQLNTSDDSGTQEADTQNGSISSAADQLLGILDTDDDKKLGTPDADDSEQDAGGDEGDQGGNQGDEQDDQNLDDNQDQDNDGGEEEEFKQEADSSRDTDDSWTIQDDEGNDQQVTGEELRKGYLRQQHFTKVTQQAAEDKRAVQAQMQNLAGQQQQYLNALNNLQSQLPVNEFAEVNWTELRETDPDEYLLMREKKRETDEKNTFIQQQKGIILQQQQQAYQGEMQQFLAGENEKLSGKDGIDGWKDGTKRADIQKTIKEYGTKSGFSSEELGQLTDSRVLKMMHKAALYDEMQGKGKKLADKKKAKAPTKVVKGGQPKTKREMSAEKKTELRNRSRKSGSVRDAGNALIGLI